MATFTPTTDPNKADASPTKEFFVDIITRDIQIAEAIHDLVDNCIDGAKRLRPNDDFTNLIVELTVNETQFQISDNCGGIPLDIARNYAFKFGRTKDFKPTKHSIGQFGIGMKRAIFKIGRKFEITTKTVNSSYKISEDINRWISDETHWDFNIDEIVQEDFSEESTGTTLLLPELNPEIGDQIKHQAFINELEEGIRLRQQDAMSKGLAIRLNEKTIVPNLVKIISSANFGVAQFTYSDVIDGREIITQVYAGVSESNRHQAGWYIYCNGRCIVEANQDRLTGWSEVTEAGVKAPKYHGQFARFRGYAFLDAEDASILPWNTTKTGINPESAAYRRLKPRLIESTRPVIDFLNALDREQDQDEDDRPLTLALSKLTPKPLTKSNNDTAFTWKNVPKPSGPTMKKISYTKSKEEVERLMEALDVKTPRDVGVSSFEFSYNNLVEED